MSQNGEKKTWQGQMWINEKNARGYFIKGVLKNGEEILSEREIESMVQPKFIFADELKKYVFFVKNDTERRRFLEHCNGLSYPVIPELAYSLIKKHPKEVEPFIDMMREKKHDSHSLFEKAGLRDAWNEMIKDSL